MGGQGWKKYVVGDELASFKQHGGRSWLNPTIPCCEKEFVSCEEGEISQIEWGSIHGLRGTLPAQLGLLTSLKEIDVERTAVSGTLPVALASAASGLRRLKIKQTNITGTLPPSLFTSGTLEELSAKQACALQVLDLRQSQFCAGSASYAADRPCPTGCGRDDLAIA
ncbi:hypothetical protein EMIHUDRAFT_253209 [Emiliania huxleyi CCMP1516]|uniref:Uncharacterized protein n=2 Tax=Emiliania huxleyi TaxID=2903 RepID=A0A0D3KB65_EMIH1|nr:hypothetical protein EMIHUDRAFT_253209 [Emiliania huxleyi CCMP1516]EOD33000.1 hypothetical protein EMIHUDRAFT_253209 [Emiliania huxleyi CCMP1516]|eukprot:XP_005785429.1 hypothetical protein EMIHUDRAFT_253209 [Emiliania huxleyi CCMP1516]